MFKKIFNPNSIPVIFIVIGLFALLLSIWGTFENLLWKETWGTFGKTILASGVFAGILKLMQISGVFKEELEKLMFEPKFLKNRNDIPSYWDKLSQELFKNKFPGISKKLLNDIKDTYFPTKSVTYYDQLEHFYEIDLDDEGVLTIKQKVSLNVICSSSKESIEYSYINSIIFKNSKDEVSYNQNYVKIDNQSPLKLKHDTSSTNNYLTNKFTITLKGQEKYEIERMEIKKYSLDCDDTIYFTAAKLTNSLSIHISHSKNLKITMYKIGTLKQFVEKQNNTTFKKYEYKDIIYPEQGYMIRLAKTN